MDPVKTVLVIFLVKIGLTNVSSRMLQASYLAFIQRQALRNQSQRVFSSRASTYLSYVLTTTMPRQLIIQR